MISLESRMLKEGQMNALRSLWIFYPAIYQAIPNSILPVDFSIKCIESQWGDFLFTPRTRGQIILDYLVPTHRVSIGVIIGM